MTYHCCTITAMILEEENGEWPDHGTDSFHFLRYSCLLLRISLISMYVCMMSIKEKQTLYFLWLKHSHKHANVSHSPIYYQTKEYYTPLSNSNIKCCWNLRFFEYVNNFPVHRNTRTHAHTQSNKVLDLVVLLAPRLKFHCSAV